ncbi:hypothetical protein UY3_03812 [Chelonia mydas]|uniref:Uncharacterized protein n=1 Tax=Chelonia mydas TaxID=8469 RepID=M7BP03_CHEMY|nr:hypothetical protein UY3_03812 [Chelonia mydas]
MTSVDLQQLFHNARFPGTVNILVIIVNSTAHGSQRPEAIPCIKMPHMKTKKLGKAYHMAIETKNKSGADPQTCHFSNELHAILWPPLCQHPTDHLRGARDPCREQRGGQEEEDAARSSSRAATQDLLQSPPESSQSHQVHIDEPDEGQRNS